MASVTGIAAAQPDGASTTAFSGTGMPSTGAHGLLQGGPHNQKQAQPVLAKDNFLLAHRGLVPGVSRLVQQKERQELMMGKTKEVDEWVAAGEVDHKTKGGVSLAKQAPVTVAKDVGDGLDGMPGLGGDADREPRDSVKSDKDDVEDESWMFKTFSKANLQNSSRQ